MSLSVDARGLHCPWPVLRLAKAMRAGIPVTIVADDPAAAGEIASLADSRGWALVATPPQFALTPPER